MKEKKNIDRLFQEKFKDFEAQPSSRVWKNIVASQKKEKNSRKIIPLWLRLGGIAAALALLVGIGTVIFSNGTPTEGTDPFVLEDAGDLNSSEQNVAASESEMGKDDLDDASFDNAQETTKDEPNLESDQVPTIKLSNSRSMKSAIATTDSGTKSNEKLSTQNRVAATLKGNTANSNRETKSNVLTPYKEDPTAIIKENKPTAITSNKESTGESLETNQDTPLIEKDIPKEKDLVAEAEKIAYSQDEDLNLPKERDVRDRWNVGAVAAPVYYGNFGGSGLDTQFKDNDKSGDVNLSYGVQISYAVTPRLKVRTGVSNVDLSYRTNDLVFSTRAGSGRQLEGVSYSINGSGVAISDASDRNLQATDGFLPGSQNNFSSGSVQQLLNYIEVPVEAVYTISDKRLGVSVIGGVSTLLLNDNEVLLRSDDLNTSLGTSNSVNDVSFTTNIGLGLDYKITEDFKFNVEPAFKYQINGYDDSVGEFKPYYLGVYTGFSYKF